MSEDLGKKASKKVIKKERRREGEKENK